MEGNDPVVIPNAEGNTLKLSIDHHLQEYTRSQLKGKKGSVVAMNPSTGEIYSMVSMPDFNPSTLKENWNDISNLASFRCNNLP